MFAITVCVCVCVCVCVLTCNERTLDSVMTTDVFDGTALPFIEMPLLLQSVTTHVLSASLNLTTACLRDTSPNGKCNVESLLRPITKGIVGSSLILVGGVWRNKNICDDDADFATSSSWCLDAWIVG